MTNSSHQSHANMSGDSTNNTCSSSPHQMTNKSHEQFNSLLPRLGFLAQRRIADTLQGQIWSVKDKRSHKDLIMKMTSKRLHTDKMSRSLLDSKAVQVLEDIVTEAHTLRYLASVPSCPPSIIGYRGFFESNKNYYLLMEDGGESMFDFIVRAHGLLATRKLDIEEWTQVVRLIFKQIIEAIDFLHTHHITHNDISLENMTVCRDIDISVKNLGEHDEKIVFRNKHHIKAKLIDFGLAQRFKAPLDDDNKQEEELQPMFQSRKFCGKRNYQSPELVAREVFDAAANDIWCAGVCLFMMMASSGPWEVADECDAAYKLISKGHIRPLLQHWGKLAYFDASLLDLISSIFQPESKRISMAEIQKHAWLNANHPVTK